MLEAFGGQTGLQIKGERGDGPVAHGEYGDAPPAEGFAERFEFFAAVHNCDHGLGSAGTDIGKQRQNAVRGVHAEGIDVRFGKRVRDRGEGIKADDDGVDVLVVEQQLGHVGMNLVVRAGVYVEGILDRDQLLQPF